MDSGRNGARGAQANPRTNLDHDREAASDSGRDSVDGFQEKLLSIHYKARTENEHTCSRIKVLR